MYLNLKSFLNFFKQIKSFSFKYKYIILHYNYDYKNDIENMGYLIWAFKIILQNKKYIDYNKSYTIEYGITSLIDTTSDKYKILDIFFEWENNQKLTIRYEEKNLLLLFQLLYTYTISLESEAFLFNKKQIKIYLNCPKNEINLFTQSEEIINFKKIVLFFSEPTYSTISCCFNSENLIEEIN